LARSKEKAQRDFGDTAANKFRFSRHPPAIRVIEIYMKRRVN
jgi:hypothetical protein